LRFPCDLPRKSQPLIWKTWVVEGTRNYKVVGKPRFFSGYIYIYINCQEATYIIHQTWGWGHYLVGDYLGWGCEGGKTRNSSKTWKNISTN
jgi:hypothetical protein